MSLCLPVLLALAHNQDAKLPPTGNTGFTGRASHHSDAAKPFKDGFVNKQSVDAVQTEVRRAHNLARQ
jgi:hypothetical protein